LRACAYCPVVQPIPILVNAFCHRKSSPDAAFAVCESHVCLGPKPDIPTLYSLYSKTLSAVKLLISESWGSQTKRAGLSALQEAALLAQHYCCMYSESHCGSQRRLEDSQCCFKGAPLTKNFGVNITAASQHNLLCSEHRFLHTSSRYACKANF
jgi:hypothetical protein